MGEQRITRNMSFYFRSSKTYMSILGIWPYQSWLSRIVLRCFWIFQHTSIMLPEAIRLYENRNNIDLIIESIPPFSYNTVMLIKFVNGIFNSGTTKWVLENMKNDWNTLVDKREIEILNYYYRSGRFLNTIYIYMVWLTLVSYMFFPLTPIVLDFINPLNESRPKSSLYLVEFFIDQDKYFYFILIHAYITSLAGVIPVFASDLLFSNCAHHACAMLEILGRRIENMMMRNQENEDTSKGESKRINEYQRAIDCVVQHQSIIEFCESINKIYNISFFIILIIELVEMSVTGFAAVMKIEDNFSDSIRFAMFTLAQIFHAFCYFFLGQNVLNYSEKLRNNAYNFNWHTASTKTKYLIKFIIMRTSKPSVISVSVYPLTLENFTTLMKTIFSYFTVMNSTR
ncbi:hypothetical protein TSAR_016928 [Trichomalopsis sarcophagae]|uniref:Odorant receptor n=1 Tax=Trichomalopsis sarcophagae TaxID=543379 RepID=A0A232EGH4_9HYME|nr:hypothetical protein TSAR_016928 [Trichomalopsis sarcophagae]